MLIARPFLIALEYLVVLEAALEYEFSAECVHLIMSSSSRGEFCFCKRLECIVDVLGQQVVSLTVARKL
jgi:hypothetical protein